MIASGSVRVNGERPPAAGVEIDPEVDRVTVDGRPVKPATSHRYLMLNKPLGVIATASDESSRATVLDVAGVPSSTQLKALREGVRLDDVTTAPAEVEMLRATKGDRDSGRAELRIVIHEGRNRQVRRMMQAIGHNVLSLRRTAFGPLKLGRLKTGGWRVLSEGEVAALHRATGLDPSRS